jgi:hypothetical protein
MNALKRARITAAHTLPFSGEAALCPGLADGGMDEFISDTAYFDADVIDEDNRWAIAHVLMASMLLDGFPARARKGARLQTCKLV